MNRAQLLRRCMVGGVVLAFGKLPETLAELPEAAAPAPEIAALEPSTITVMRTGIPTAARINGRPAAITAQHVEWLEDEIMPEYASNYLYPDEISTIRVPPGNQNYFKVDDIIREEDTGECMVVVAIGHKTTPGHALNQIRRGDMVLPAAAGYIHHALDVQYVGWTRESVPIIDPGPELAELAAALNPPKTRADPDDLEHLANLRDRQAKRRRERESMRSFADYEAGRQRELARRDAHNRKWANMSPEERERHLWG